MSIFDDIRKDAEAGTPGPWRIHNCDGMGDRCTYYYQEVWNDETGILVTTEVTRAHSDGGRVNMRRIARVPQLEAIALAAEELAKAVAWHPAPLRNLSEALAAFREATK